jgi:hypothetical protein
MPAKYNIKNDEELKNMLFTKVLPTFRKTGEYTADSNDRRLFKKIKQKEEVMKKLNTKNKSKKHKKIGSKKNHTKKLSF